MTLVEELEQAARRARALCSACARSGAMNDAYEATREADQLEARAAHVQKLEAAWLAQCQETGSEPAAIALLAASKLTGDLP